MTAEPFFDELFSRIVSQGIENKQDLHRAKTELCGKYALVNVPSDSEVLSHATPEIRERMRNLLKIKRTRSASGVAVVSVMTAPYPCPHGKCIYCPGGPDVGTPQSYTGKEPAAMRAIHYDYDPCGQTRARLEQLRAMGHPTDKIELIILGGTFTNLEADYREWFVKNCLDAMNERPSTDLQEAQGLNERADSRCIGLTVETRPDCFGDDQVRHSMSLGVTRVELGVQSVFDDVLSRVGRGHDVEQVRVSTAAAKNYGLKVCYHMMPGLPGSTATRDIESFRTIFSNEEYRPDMLKIYPAVVLRGTEMYEMWRRGEYAPLSTEEAVRLIAQIKRIVPPWVRIQRIQREIEIHSIQAGVDKGHLRDLARRALAATGEKCRCIRCREVGLNGRDIDQSDILMRRTDYVASGGRETFLSFEDESGQTLVGYLRMRMCNAGVFLRELKVFGEVVPFGEPPDARWQHQGYGKKLVTECERIAAEEHDARELKVTSGVGARDYYRRLDYHLDEPYMVKVFPDS